MLILAAVIVLVGPAERLHGTFLRALVIALVGVGLWYGYGVAAGEILGDAGHTLAAAARPHASALAPEPREVLVAARAALHACKPVNQEATQEEGSQLVVDEAWQTRGKRVAESHECLQRLLKYAVQSAVLWLAPPMAARPERSGYGRGGGQVASRR